MKRYLLIVLVCFALVAAILCWAILASAATTSVTLAWDANTEADLSGYKLYRATAAAGPFAAIQTLGKVTTTTVAGLADGSYWFKLTATDTYGNESGFSNTVTFLADTIPPAIPATLRVTSAVVTP